jgi:hypothetical protein
VSARVFKSVVISCNRPGCLVEKTLVAERMADARKAAEFDDGWKSVSLPVPTGGPAVSADLCPDHVDYQITLAEVRDAPVRKVG